MIDKIVLGKNEAVIFYTNRTPVTLVAGEGEDIRMFLAWFLRNDTSLTLTEFTAAVGMESEVTATINVDKLKIA